MNILMVPEEVINLNTLVVAGMVANDESDVEIVKDVEARFSKEELLLRDLWKDRSGQLHHIAMKSDLVGLMDYQVEKGFYAGDILCSRNARLV